MSRFLQDDNDDVIRELMARFVGEENVPTPEEIHQHRLERSKLSSELRRVIDNHLESVGLEENDPNMRELMRASYLAPVTDELHKEAMNWLTTQIKIMDERKDYSNDA